MVNLVIQRSSNEELFRSDKTFMNKLNMVLVQIVKQARRLADAAPPHHSLRARWRCTQPAPALPLQEWPHAWPTFISDIVAASKTNESLCENNMAVCTAGTP